jgi:hypothetical protein
VKKILIFTAIALIVLGIFFSQFFIATQIDCRSQFGECPKEILNDISVLNGKRLNVVKKGLNKVLESSFLVSTYSLQFKLPNVIRTELIIKKPLFALKNEGGTNYALIDIDGYVLAQSQETALPTLLIAEQLPAVGQQINGAIFFALKLIDGLYKMYQVRGGVITNDTLLVDLPGPVRVIFPLVDADRDLLLGSLRLIYSNVQSKEGAGVYKEIDMRYENPVLR